MPRLRIILEDDEGNPIPSTRRTYHLEGECDTLDGIERAVEDFKKRALPEVERSLLTEAQKRFVEGLGGIITSVLRRATTTARLPPGRV